MPMSKLHAPASFSNDHCRATAAALHESLVATCAVNPDDDFCLITRYPAEAMVVHPTFLGTRDPAATLVVEITLLRGRTDAQKDALFGDFRDRYAALGGVAENVIMFLVENGPNDFSFSNQGSVKTVLGL